MSGIIGSRLNVRGSGPIGKLGTDGQVLTSAGAGKQLAFEDVAGGISWQAVETGSTMTAVAGNGYPIDTSSNACTITLPASASNGDQIIFTDYARNWGTNKIEIDSNGLNYQGEDDSYTVEYTTDGQSVNIVYSGATKGWIPIEDDAVADVPVKLNSEGIFGYGHDSSGATAVSNLVSNAGVVATDVTGVGTAKYYLAATEYGTDKAIFGFGAAAGDVLVNETNLVSNAGVIASDVTGIGTVRKGLAACRYGGDKGIFGYGATVSLTNLVSNAGVVATDTTGVGTARYGLAATQYGGDKGIFGYGDTSGAVSMTNLVSNTGVVATDTTGVGTARYRLAACGYSTDKGIFGYGWDASSNLSLSNLISNAGVVATDVTGVGTVRQNLAACEYGGDKGIFGYGTDDAGTYYSMTNLVSNAGVIATDTTGVGTDRHALAACSFN
jgi:hypothetical protein